jgi:putative solute:sodium symporter small subunit
MATNNKKYWSENLRLMAILLGVWFLVSFGFGIIFVDALNGIEIAGFKLGFWFAQQGSIFVFVALIFIYVALMNRLDHKHGLEEVEEKPDAPSQQS